MSERGMPPDAAGRAKLLETHTALLFFVGDRVYKLKKAVDLGFLNFSTPQARRAACMAEVELNRRLSPDVYLGVADIVGRDGAVCDSLVVMRRMPSQRRLSRLATAVPRPPDLDAGLAAVARLMADFHQRCPSAADSPAIAEAGSVVTSRRLWQDNLAVLRHHVPDVLDASVVARLDRLSAGYLSGREPLFAARLAAGHIRDGHGDLLADDIFLLTDGPRVLDCLEFDPRLRAGDVLNDVAFLAMDLERLGASADAAAFLSEYARCGGERHPASLAHLFLAYRASVRCKVSCLRWAQGDAESAETARSLATLADRHLQRAAIRLVVVGGLPGTGKSTVAAAIGGGEGWTVLRSDVVRKELAGLRPEQPARSAYGTGMYTAQARRETYRELLRRARQALQNGYSVVLDASFSDEADRAAAARLAQQTSAILVEIECRVPQPIARQRLARRATQGADASDADADIAAAMAQEWHSWPSAHVLDTSRPREDVDEAAAELIRRRI